MGLLQLLGSTLGLGLVSGLNLYATVLTVGLGIRLGLIELRPELQTLEALAHPLVLIVAGAIFLVQFLADKIKWVDSLWDAVHSFIRPLGAAIIGATSVGEVGPEMVLVAALCGGVAVSGHSTKAGVRLLANHSPEPFSNIALSLTEDVLVVAGCWFALQYPVAMLVIVVVFVGLFLWFAPKALRLIRLEVSAIFAILRLIIIKLKRLTMSAKSRLSRRDRINKRPEQIDPLDGTSLMKVLNAQMPVNYVYYLNDSLNLNGEVARIRCAAGNGMRGLRYSVGYLNITDDQLIFLTRKLFRFRSRAIPINAIDHVHFRKSLFLDRLNFRTGKKRHVLYFFKDAMNRGQIVCSVLQKKAPSTHRRN